MKDPTAAWDISLVLRCLRGPPFEPMVTCFLLNLCMNVVFLVAIMLAQRVGNIGDLIERAFFHDILKGQGFLTSAP